MEDNRIIELYEDRDESAIFETEKKYSRLIHRIAKNIVGNESDAEECVNDTYLSIWNAIPPEKPRIFAAFAAKIARNTALKKLEYNLAKKRTAGDIISLSDLDEVIGDNDPINNMEDIEVGALITEFLKGEREEARNVFLRKYFFFDSIEDIAIKYGFSASKVKSMLFHTRNKLKIFLENKGVVI